MDIAVGDIVECLATRLIDGRRIPYGLYVVLEVVIDGLFVCRRIEQCEDDIIRPTGESVVLHYDEIVLIKGV